MESTLLIVLADGVTGSDTVVVEGNIVEYVLMILGIMGGTRVLLIVERTAVA